MPVVTTTTEPDTEPGRFIERAGEYLRDGHEVVMPAKDELIIPHTDETAGEFADDSETASDELTTAPLHVTGVETLAPAPPTAANVVASVEFDQAAHELQLTRKMGGNGRWVFEIRREHLAN